MQKAKRQSSAALYYLCLAVANSQPERRCVQAVLGLCSMWSKSAELTLLEGTFLGSDNVEGAGHLREVLLLANFFFISLV